MKLYLISQKVNNGYDTYDSAVVVSDTEDSARRISPDKYYVMEEDNEWYFKYSNGEKRKENHDSWCELKDVSVEYIGEAGERFKAGTVIVASFNAG